MTKSNIDKWITAGYDIFASEGPEGIRIEKLAKKIGLNKSGFYHYFGDKKDFFFELIQYHYSINDQYLNQLPHITDFDPGFFNLILKYKTTLLFQSQLIKHSGNPLFKGGFDRVRTGTEMHISRVWSDYLGLNKEPELSIGIFNLFRNSFFIRVTPDNCNIDFLREQASQVRDLIQKLINKPH
jgi:AcrR family transcriptional regulator